MSGHSKWSKVKHQKAVTDVRKAASFTKASRAITIAVVEGGGVSDPDQNFHLRLAMEKARDVNMPKENIERLIAKAKGEGAGQMNTMMYEAYGPGGVAMLIEAMSDNNKRTVSAIKNLLEHHGAALAGLGSVRYQFIRSGVIVVRKTQSYENMLELALDAHIDDVAETGDYFELYCPVNELNIARTMLISAKVEIDNLEIIMKPKTIQSISDADTIALDTLIEAIDELDDVQHVYTNHQEV